MMLTKLLSLRCRTPQCRPSVLPKVEFQSEWILNIERSTLALPPEHFTSAPDQILLGGLKILNHELRTGPEGWDPLSTKSVKGLASSSVDSSESDLMPNPRTFE